MTTPCTYNDCTRPATTRDAEGDHCCLVHSAAEYTWVLTDSLDGSWLTEAHAARVEAEFADMGIDITIRRARSGEADGYHAVDESGDGSLRHKSHGDAYEAIVLLMHSVHNNTNIGD